MNNKKQKGFLEIVYDFYKGFDENEVTLAYEGEMNHQVMLSFTEQVIGKMALQSDSINLQNLVYHVLVECLQNISKHAFHTDTKSGTELNHGVLLVTNTEKAYHITTGNVIEKERIPILKESLSNINSMERKELDNLYKKQLSEGTLSKKGGAGLGFIDIKRKTSQKLDFHFLPLDDTHSFFLLTSTINRNSKN